MRVNTAITYFLVLDTCNTRCDVMTSFNAIAAFVSTKQYMLSCQNALFKAAISNVKKEYDARSHSIQSYIKLVQKI